MAGDANIEDEIKRIDAKLEEYVKLEKHYQVSIRTLETQQNELTAQKATLENQRNIYTESHKGEEEKLRVALLDKGFADAAEVEQSVLPREEQKALSDEIDVYDQEERKIKVQSARKMDGVEK